MTIEYRYADLVSGLDAEVAGFLGRTPEELARQAETARDERNRRWVEADPKNEEERNALYSSLGELDLIKYARWHQEDVEKQELHDLMVEVAHELGQPVLDCGGGIGDTTLAFAKNGLDVMYVDFPGICSDFARQRWERHGCLDRIRALTPQEFWTTNERSFGLIASIDVLEHLENPVKHAARYYELLSSGGELFLTTHFVHNAKNPDHLVENEGYRRIFGGERKTARRSVLTNLGFRRKKWYRFQRP